MKKEIKEIIEKWIKRADELMNGIDNIKKEDDILMITKFKKAICLLTCSYELRNICENLDENLNEISDDDKEIEIVYKGELSVKNKNKLNSLVYKFRKQVRDLNIKVKDIYLEVKEI